MTAVGIKLEFVTQKWPDLLKMARGGQLQMWQLGNRATTHGGLRLPGPALRRQRGTRELSRFKHADYDRLYDASATARRPGAREADAPDVADRRRVRAVEDQRVPLRERHRCIRGSKATSSTCSTSTRGNTSTSTAKMAAHGGAVKIGAMRQGRFVLAARAMRRTRRVRAGRPEQGAARRVPHGGDGFRSAGGFRSLLELRQSRDVRAAVPLRLPRAPAQGRAQYDSRASRRQQGRHGMDDQGQARHLLHRRSRVQGQEARAHRGRLRLHLEAHRSIPRCARRRSICSTGASWAWTRCVAKAKETGKFDYDAPVEGMQVVDRYTLKLKLNVPLVGHRGRPDRRFGRRGRTRGGRGVRRRESAGSWRIPSAPVRTSSRNGVAGSGSCSRRTRASAAFPTSRAAIPRTRRSTRGCKGKTFPPIGRVDIAIMEEGNPRVLAFAQGRARLSRRALPSSCRT